MIVRHLILPQGQAGTPGVLNWIAKELSPSVHISLMDQYFPAHQAVGDPINGRKISRGEVEAALTALDQAGLQNGWCQTTTEECG
jgi:putative pyruvate formate lyase activating enzyme